MTNKEHTVTKRRRLRGVVISTAMQKSAVVRVDRRLQHPKYGKFYSVSKKYAIHDPENAAKMGALVEIEECRPISRNKRWRYVSTIENA